MFVGLTNHPKRSAKVYRTLKLIIINSCLYVYRGREADSRPSCAPAESILIKRLNQEDLMGIYLLQANVVLFRSNFLIWSNTNSLYRLNVNISLCTICFIIYFRFILHFLQSYMCIVYFSCCKACHFVKAWKSTIENVYKD